MPRKLCQCRPHLDSIQEQPDWVMSSCMVSHICAIVTTLLKGFLARCAAGPGVAFMMLQTISRNVQGCRSCGGQSMSFITACDAMVAAVFERFSRRRKFPRRSWQRLSYGVIRCQSSLFGKEDGTQRTPCRVHLLMLPDQSCSANSTQSELR